jgi:hypothetical protein
VTDENAERNIGEPGMVRRPESKNAPFAASSARNLAVPRAYPGNVSVSIRSAIGCHRCGRFAILDEMKDDDVGEIRHANS